MKKNIKFTENKAKVKEVSNEKEGTQDRALGDTRGDEGGGKPESAAVRRLLVIFRRAVLVL